MKLAGRWAKILAFYLSPSRTLLRPDLTICLSSGLPVLMADNLYAKNVDWNSRLTIFVTIKLSTLVYLTACWAFSLDHLPVLTDTRCKSSFLNLPDRPIFRRTDLSEFQARLDHDIPFNVLLPDEAIIYTYVEELSCAIRRALEVSTLKRWPLVYPRSPIPTPIQDEIRLKNRLSRRRQITRNPVLKAEVNPLQRLVTE